jgi:hypothetical protein
VASPSGAAAARSPSSESPDAYGDACPVLTCQALDSLVAKCQARAAVTAQRTCSFPANQHKQVRLPPPVVAGLEELAEMLGARCAGRTEARNRDRGGRSPTIGDQVHPHFSCSAHRGRSISGASRQAHARALCVHIPAAPVHKSQAGHCGTQTDRAGRPGAPALFLLCAQRAQHIRRQSSGARARAVRAHVLLHLVHKSQAGTAALRLTVLSLQAKSVSAFLGELANGKLLSPGSVLHETLRWYQLGIHTLQGQVHDLQARNLTAAESARAQRVNEFQGLLDQAHRESADLRKRLSTAEAKLRTQACRFSAAEHAVEACKPDSAVRHCLSHGAGERQ